MSDFKCNECGAAEGEPCKRTSEPAEPMVPPHPNKYWNRVQTMVCLPRWGEWKEMEVKVINEYRLNMLEREHRQMLKKSMSDFLALDGQSTGAGEMPDLVAREWKPTE